MNEYVSKKYFFCTNYHPITKITFYQYIQNIVNHLSQIK